MPGVWNKHLYLEYPLYSGKVQSTPCGISKALIKVQSPPYWWLTIEHFHSWQPFRKSLLHSCICYKWLSSTEKGFTNLCHIIWDFEGLPPFCVLCSKFLGVRLPTVLFPLVGRTKGWNPFSPRTSSGIFREITTHFWNSGHSFNSWIQLEQNSIYSFPRQVRLTVLHEGEEH